MPFYCHYGKKPGESPDHKHETVAEMRSAHGLHGAKQSVPAASSPAAGTSLPEPASVPAAADSRAPRVPPTAPEPVATLSDEYRWIDRQPWHETKRQDARKFGMRSRESLPISPDTWKNWSDEWDAVVAVDGNGRVVNEPRLKLLKGMISMIPDGYYAAQADDTATVDFVMISRPNRGNYKDHIKVSTQHSENWMPRLALMPNGRWLVLDRSVIEPLMLVVADHRTCARRYAIELQHCCVCNTALTDDRSRHYLIGPICDKKPQWQHVIEEVDDINGGLSYEDLVRLGQPTRVWQEKILL